MAEHDDPRKDATRDTILRRRARFIRGSAWCALAAVSCTPARDGGGGDGTPTVSLGPTTDETTSTTVAAPDPTTTTTADKPEGDWPPFDVPAGVSETAKKRYDSLHEAMRAARDNLLAADAALLDCDPKLPACEAAFTKVATALHDTQRTLRMMYRCPGKSPEGQAYGIHEDRHVNHAQARLEAARTAAEAATAKAKDKWDKVKQDVESARAYPCLSFACLDW